MVRVTKRPLLLVAMLALLVGPALPVSVAGASGGPEKGLGAICERVEAGTWHAGSLACPGLHVDDTRAFDVICERALHGFVIELLANPRYDEVVPDGWACRVQ